jgi:hemerythrin-like domain-containing protein
MTHQPYEGATSEQLQHPLVRELLGVHNMFRNELVTIVRYVDELLAGEQLLIGSETTTRVQAVIRAGAQYTQMLHMHHHIETASMFPALREEGLGAAVIDRLNAEHDEIAVLIDKFSQSIRGLSAIDPAVMDTDLRRLAEALHAHLAYEETHVCPFLARFSR